MKKIKVKINNKKSFRAEPETSINDLLNEHCSEKDYLPYIIALNNKYAPLNAKISTKSKIKTIKNYNSPARRAYENAALLILSHIAQNVCPNNKLIIAHSMSKGLYCEFKGKEYINKTLISDLKRAFNKLVKKDLPLKEKPLTKSDAIKYFDSINREDITCLVKYSTNTNIQLYSLEQKIYWLPSPPVYRTGLIVTFDIIPFAKGFILRYPVEDYSNILPEFIIQDRLYEIFTEFEEWGRILGITDVGHINRLVMTESISEIIKVSEALHEKKIITIADLISKLDTICRLVFIAGPSSSGKTTFMKRLYIQLRVLGFRIITLSLDNYFKDRAEIKREYGEKFSFDVLEALNLDLINKHLQLLIKGKSINLTKFDFKAGKKIYSNIKVSADENTIFLIEGIHGLNPNLTYGIDDPLKFKIYINALTHLNFDNSNRIPTNDTRLIRRIVRDCRYRGYSAAKTIEMWKKVVDGEKRYIFPYQEKSRVMFNSSLVYEIGVLKKYAEKYLKTVSAKDPQYPEADRLLYFLSYFLPISDNEVPPTSMLREFIGNSSFIY